MDPSERYRRLTQIFMAICDLEEPQRTQELEHFCVGDSGLRSEIERLLAYHDRLTVKPGNEAPPSRWN